MAPSTAELYTPRRNINGPKCAHYGLRKEKVSFAGKGGKTAENNGIPTYDIMYISMISQQSMIS